MFTRPGNIGMISISQYAIPLRKFQCQASTNQALSTVVCATWTQRVDLKKLGDFKAGVLSYRTTNLFFDVVYLFSDLFFLLIRLWLIWMMFETIQEIPSWNGCSFQEMTMTFAGKSWILVYARWDVFLFILSFAGNMCRKGYNFVNITLYRSATWNWGCPWLNTCATVLSLTKSWQHCCFPSQTECHMSLKPHIRLSEV